MRARGVKRRAVVALTTDFGHDDPFVGVMKGVILSICPDAALVDLTHGVPPQDVLAGCLALESAEPFFPPGTIHVAVVDPGVGTDRRSLLVRTDRAFYLAPDNGLLSFLEAGEIREIRSIGNPDYFLHPVSCTFHGRDVFAPAAAHLAGGAPPTSFGPRLSGMARLSIPGATPLAFGVAGEVLAFDRFGNALTSIRARDLPADSRAVWAGGKELPLAPTYDAVPPGAPLGLVGSSGRLEISISRGSARDSLGLRKGDPVQVRS